MEDPNINPVWDTLLGDATHVAVMRLMALVLGFILVVGTAFTLAG